jgi:hypothetical protein
MRSQFRLRVLLPVAVLGLLGIGVGAFAMGGPPDGAGLGTTAATTTTAPPPPPPASSLATWAEAADKLCAQASRRLREAGFPTTPEQAVAFLERYLQVYRELDGGLAALGAPEGETARVESLRALSTEALQNAQAMLQAIQASDRAEVLRIARRNEGLAADIARIVTTLGADRCAEDPFAPADPERGLSGALEENKVVVVLLYTPGSNYDTIQAREARAGAAAGGAGFLAVDVSRDRQVASLAAAFEIRDAPALLVVKQGFRIAVRISGYADRETIAQAAANARG